ncbi:glycosyltransferase [Helicobacter cetorum]|uniref:glycosyltransferase n=1 Tax=Helicobacter cetorum TaxID=138563 RepID=UPI000CF19543|nr:glycosyltransferase [Helicobacter cetorum]
MLDYVIVTHLPTFYKINLYNELAKNLKIFVVFLALDTHEKRASDFSHLDNISFEYLLLSKNNLQNRPKLKNILQLKTLLKNRPTKRVLISGWDCLEFWFLRFLNPKSKNAIVVESSIYESKTCGLKAWLKKFFLKKISLAFVCAKTHKELLKALNFKGEIRETLGVGIINKLDFKPKMRKYHKKFLFVGRLIKIKNLELLIEVFRELQDYHLSLVGVGELEESLKELAKGAVNIQFLGAMPNAELSRIYLEHDMLILASLKETWGLVVEEALYYKMPVIVSENCGASALIKHGVNGFIFKSSRKESLKEILLDLDNKKYLHLLEGVEEFSLDKKDKRQVAVYSCDRD